MRAASAAYAVITYRSSPAFFLAQTAQHVESHRPTRELARAAAALLGLGSWAGVLLLLSG